MRFTSICPICVNFLEGGKPEYPGEKPWKHTRDQQLGTQLTCNAHKSGMHHSCSMGFTLRSGERHTRQLLDISNVIDQRLSNQGGKILHLPFSIKAHFPLDEFVCSNTFLSIVMLREHSQPITLPKKTFARTNLPSEKRA